MERDNLQVLIIGGGQAGARAAKVMRDRGFAGRVVIIGDEPDPPYERPPLSKALLLDPNEPDPAVLSIEKAQDLDIELLLDRTAVSIDRIRQTVALADGSEHHYDRLLLATGCRARRLEIRGSAPNLCYLRSLSEARALERRLTSALKMVVVGGGFIGLEVAASATARGCDVTVLEASDRLLPRLGAPEASRLVLQHHSACGIKFRLGCQIDFSDRSGLVLFGGERIEADLVVAGVGVTPNTEIAERAGLEVSNGIVTDATGQTSDPLIYAAGDVARQFSGYLGRAMRFESWQSANFQAEAAACAIVGAPAPELEVPWIWSDQGDLNVQIAGSPEAVDQVVLRGDELEHEGVSVFQFMGGRLVGGLTLNRGKEMPLIRRMLAGEAATPAAVTLSDVTIPLRRAIAEASA